jgi:hypothetical protein
VHLVGPTVLLYYCAGQQNIKIDLGRFNIKNIYRELQVRNSYCTQHSLLETKSPVIV